MQFAIQPSNPVPANRAGEDDTALGEVIESIFPLLTEFAIIIWHDIYVPISYKYDVSVMINDILAMLDAIITQESGILSIDWPSSTFCARWRLQWTTKEVFIDTRWTSVLGGVENLLNANPHLVTDKEQFLAEWGGLIRVVRKAICKSLHDSSAQSHLSSLDQFISRIKIRGCLYVVET